MDSGEDARIIAWPEPPPPRSGRPVDRVEWVLGLFVALHTKELLSALPDCEIARQKFSLAMQLLARVELELADVYVLMSS